MVLVIVLLAEREVMEPGSQPTAVSVVLGAAVFCLDEANRFGGLETYRELNNSSASGALRHWVEAYRQLAGVDGEPLNAEEAFKVIRHTADDLRRLRATALMWEDICMHHHKKYDEITSMSTVAVDAYTRLLRTLGVDAGKARAELEKHHKRHCQACKKES